MNNANLIRLIKKNFKPEEYRQEIINSSVGLPRCSVERFIQRASRIKKSNNRTRGKIKEENPK